MKANPIEDPLDGEQVVAVQPPLQARPEAGDRARLAYFTGRSLTHTDLRQEQRARAAALAGLGRALSPGVVSGLQVSAQTSEQANEKGAQLQIGAGLGIARSGEILSLGHNRRVRLDDIRVYAPAALLDGQVGAGAMQGAYRLGDSFGTLRKAGINLPKTLILVLQPVSVAHYAGPERADPCDRDPSDEAFENWQWVDGVRLLLYAWNPIGPRFQLPSRLLRNRAAYQVFRLEEDLAEGEQPAWWAIGLPVALLGVDDTGRLLFLDRNCVVRRGGEARGEGALVRPAGDRFLWQARFEQFNEQLLDILRREPRLHPASLEASGLFRFLPPVGILPAQAMRLREPATRQRFFPPGYRVQARPVPIEALDQAIAESACLQPFDLLQPSERVEVLVPLPGERFDPEVLKLARVDVSLANALGEARTRRDDWLGRRRTLRRRVAALQQAIAGEARPFPPDDAAAVEEGEAPAVFERDLLANGECRRHRTSKPPQGWFGIAFDDTPWADCAASTGSANAGRLYQRIRFDATDGRPLPSAHRYTLRVPAGAAGEDMQVYLNERRLRLRPSPAAGGEARDYPLGELRGLLRARGNLLAIGGLREAGAIELLDTEDVYGTREEQGEPRSRALVGLQEALQKEALLTDDDHARLAGEGIDAFMASLRQRIARANDHVDFGFLRLRTDIYRVRQSMLGKEAATRLATSPVLAAIADGESASATRRELNRFYERIKGGLSSGVDAPADGGNDSNGGSGNGEGNGGDGGGPGLERVPGGNVWGGMGLSSGSWVPLGSGVGMATDIADLGFTTGTRGTGGAGVGGKVAMTAYAKAQLWQPLKMQVELAAAASEEDVMGETPLVGWASRLANVTVGQRLEVSGPELGYQSGLALKNEIVAELETRLAETGFQVDSDLLARVKNADFAPDTTGEGKPDITEGRFFDAGVRLMENVTRLLRHVEARIAAYRAILARCEKVRARILHSQRRAGQRLAVIEGELAEARHDVSVARTLLAEETARVAAINARRERLLRTAVKFLVFRRPRRVDARQQGPVHDLYPDLAERPLPVCESSADAPEPLAVMLDALREAPLRWFTAVRTLMPQFSRVEDLRLALAGARARAQVFDASPRLQMFGFHTGSAVWRGLGPVLAQAGERIARRRQETARVDPARFARLGWGEIVQRLPEVISLGDVIDGRHGRAQASRDAARELARIGDVATCLYEGFSAVPAVIRLQWAERLSQFDRPVRLRNLLDLPRFGELDYLLRQRMQHLVDWLYGRVDGNRDEALDLIGDLVRVALLTASHAPSTQLVNARLTAPATLRPGVRIRLVADLTRVRVGMRVTLAAGSAQAIARVADIVGDEVVAEMTQAPAKGLVVDSGARVQIGARLQSAATAFTAD